MTFASRLATDMDRILSTDEFGESVTYRYPSGATTTFTAHIGAVVTEHQEVNGIRTTIYRTYCTWAAASLSSPDLRGVIIKSDGTEWSISNNSKFEDAQQVSVTIERHQLNEQTRAGFRAL